MARPKRTGYGLIPGDLINMRGSTVGVVVASLKLPFVPDDGCDRALVEWFIVSDGRVIRAEGDLSRYRRIPV